MPIYTTPLTTALFLQLTAMVALGGAVGAVLRFYSMLAINTLLGRDFPYGTLFVNISGSLIMGVLYVWATEKADLSALWQGLLLVGLIGAFTTFSTFAFETLNLLSRGQHLAALLNILTNVFCCLAAAYFGILASEMFYQTKI